MNVWRLTAPRSLDVIEGDAAPEEGKPRIRVSKVLVLGADAEFFRGEVKCSYPCIPGRFAVGFVSEDSDLPDFPKGRRVLLHTFRPMPDAGTEKCDFSRPNYDVCGQTVNGFLRDVIYLSPDEMTPLPDSVGDKDALLLHHVALAKASVDCLNVQKGQHVAVVGANAFGLLVCQLLIYQQAAPILIDVNKDRLEFAKNCGVYYTALVDDALVDTVGTLTGGRLTNGSIYSLSSKIDPSVSSRVCATGTSVVLAGIPTGSVKIDVEHALKRELTVHAVSDCTDYLETAINLVAQKAVTPARFEAKPVKVVNAAKAFLEYTEEAGKLTYIDLI